VTEAEWIAFLARPEIPAFNRAMLENPDDDLPRLVFADWMEENHSHSRFVRQVGMSIRRPNDVLHCPAFPELRGVKAGIWRGRLALKFVPVAGISVRLSRDELRFLRVVLDSSWLGRISLWVHGVEGEVTSPEFVPAVRWAEIEWLEIGGEIDWRPALEVFVIAHPDRFPKLSALIHRGYCPDGPTLDTLLTSPLLRQLNHLALGDGQFLPETTTAVLRSTALSDALKARWRRTDDGGANR
jgi:uncharacterized protein (TIGR02996 family)